MKHIGRVIPKEEILANRCNAYEFIDFDKINKMEEIKEKIVEYLNDNTSNFGHLRVLDESEKNSYTGVTLDYIHEYVLENEYTLKEVAQAILELHDLGIEDIGNRVLTCLRCSDVQNFVFQNKANIWNYTTTYSNWGQTMKSDLYEYLNQIIKNEN